MDNVVLVSLLLFNCSVCITTNQSVNHGVGFVMLHAVMHTNITNSTFLHNSFFLNSSNGRTSPSYLAPFLPMVSIPLISYLYDTAEQCSMSINHIHHAAFISMANESPPDVSQRLKLLLRQSMSRAKDGNEEGVCMGDICAWLLGSDEKDSDGGTVKYKKEFEIGDDNEAVGDDADGDSGSDAGNDGGNDSDGGDGGDGDDRGDNDTSDGSHYLTFLSVFPLNASWSCTSYTPSSAFPSTPTTSYPLTQTVCRNLCNEQRPIIGNKSSCPLPCTYNPVDDRCVFNECPEGHIPMYGVCVYACVIPDPTDPTGCHDQCVPPNTKYYEEIMEDENVENNDNIREFVGLCKYVDFVIPNDSETTFANFLKSPLFFVYVGFIGVVVLVIVVVIVCIVRRRLKRSRENKYFKEQLAREYSALFEKINV